jgi:hypothetical protein
MVVPVLHHRIDVIIVPRRRRRMIIVVIVPLGRRRLVVMVPCILRSQHGGGRHGPRAGDHDRRGERGR